jgi:phage tail sheath protein FI
MSVTTSFPGIYIQELPAATRTITAAPTSIAVFVGYTHPYKTVPAMGVATAISDFTEYRRLFGGLFRSDYIDPNLPYAVRQFFNNNGAQAYVVPLWPSVSVPGQASMRFYDNPPTTALGPLVFTGLEPIDANTSLVVTAKNIRQDPNNQTGLNMADIVVSYGSFVTETFRGVSLVSTSKDFINVRINGPSTLVTVAPASGTTYGFFTSATDQTVQFAYPASFQNTLNNLAASVFNRQEYIDQFAPDTSLDKIDTFNLLLMPGVTDNAVLSGALPLIERKRAFMIMDAPANATADGLGAQQLPTLQQFLDSGVIPYTDHGALYFPYLSVVDELTGNLVRLPPSGFVAGMYAQTDNNRGISKAPAGLETVLQNTLGVVPDGRLTDSRAGTLNLQNVNAIRTFPGAGTVIFGARTFIPAVGGAFDQWKYIPVRRMALFLEQTFYRSLGWVVFEPNAEPLWIAIRHSIEAFMLSLFRRGAFAGASPDEAFQVKCDSSTTTQTDIDNGIVNILVAFAPLKPAEFVVIQIAQMAGQVQS